MLIELTDRFTDDEALKNAVRACGSLHGNHQPVVLTWSKLAKLALRTGVPMLRKPILNKVSLIVEVSDKEYNVGYAPPLGYQMLEKASMIRVAANQQSPTSLDSNRFDEWWGIYPYRDVNGRKVKVGRKNAQRRFYNQIRNMETFAQLMEATRNYSNVCDKKPRDAERFLKDDFWKDFLEITVTASVAKQTKEIQAIDLSRMLND